jgi:hypothetical protein
MKSPKKRAQRNDVKPWSVAGGRRCIAARSYRDAPGRRTGIPCRSGP